MTRSTAISEKNKTMLATIAATVLLSQQAAAAPIKTTPSAPTVYAGSLNLDLEGMEGKLTFTATRSTTKKDDGTSIAVAWSKCQLNISGQEQDLPDLDAFTYLQKADGTVSGFSGGIPELPAAQVILLMHLCTGKEPLASGKSSEFNIAKSDANPAFKVSVKRLDDEKLDGVAVQVYEQTAKSEGDDTLDTTGKFYVTAEGALLKVEQAIKSIHVGDGGGSAKGKFTLTLKK